METDFGVSVFIPYENLIIRKKQWGLNWSNDWIEQSNTIELNNKESNNIYIISGDNKSSVGEN